MSISRTSAAGSRRRPASHSQRGAALIVGLIMLLLLTLIGVAGMKDTLLQEKMVGNARDRDIALQAAEAALRVAENQLSSPVLNLNFASNSNGLYDRATPIGKSLTVRTKTELEFWRNDVWWTNARSVEYPRTLTGVLAGSSPRYVIEKMDVALSSRSAYPNLPGSTKFVSEGGLGDGSEAEVKDISDYRITARAVGSSAEAVVILQSTFRRDSE